ncbi:MAG: hypothetical protein HW384_1491 [Dehalococcoidia bacterium]|nr:hypothetical protein [Dehalococcoidia bacterium]
MAVKGQSLQQNSVTYPDQRGNRIGDICMGNTINIRADSNRLEFSSVLGPLHC